MWSVHIATDPATMYNLKRKRAEDPIDIFSMTKDEMGALCMHIIDVDDDNAMWRAFALTSHSLYKLINGSCVMQRSQLDTMHPGACVIPPHLLMNLVPLGTMYPLPMPYHLANPGKRTSFARDMVRYILCLHGRMGRNGAMRLFPPSYHIPFDGPCADFKQFVRAFRGERHIRIDDRGGFWVLYGVPSLPMGATKLTVYLGVPRSEHMIDPTAPVQTLSPTVTDIALTGDPRNVGAWLQLASRNKLERIDLSGIGLQIYNWGNEILLDVMKKTADTLQELRATLTWIGCDVLFGDNRGTLARLKEMHLLVYEFPEHASIRLAGGLRLSAPNLQHFNLKIETVSSASVNALMRVSVSGVISTRKGYIKWDRSEWSGFYGEAEDHVDTVCACACGPYKSDKWELTFEGCYAEWDFTQ